MLLQIFEYIVFHIYRVLYLWTQKYCSVFHLIHGKYQRAFNLQFNTIPQALINPPRNESQRGHFWDCACVGLVESSFSWSISSRQTIPSHINKNVSEIVNQKWSSVYQVENQLTVSMFMLFKVTPTTLDWHLCIGWTTRASRHRNPFSCVSGAS